MDTLEFESTSVTLACMDVLVGVLLLLTVVCIACNCTMSAAFCVFGTCVELRISCTISSLVTLGEDVSVDVAVVMSVLMSVSFCALERVAMASKTA